MTSNIKIVAVERTQSIQFFNFPSGQGSGFAPDNSIPLINRKPTILRVYIDASRNDNSIPVPTSVDGFVWAFNPNTSAGGNYNSVNGPITGRAAPMIQRAQTNHTLDIMIPWDVCQDQVLCEIAIYDADNRLSQNSDVFYLTLDFIEVPTMNVHSVLIHYTGPDYFDRPVDAQTGAFNVLFAMDYLLRTYPVSDFNFDGCEVIRWSDKLAVTANFYSLSAKIASMRAMSGTNDVYIALIPPAAGCGGTCGLGGGGSALFFSGDTLDQTGAAHEIGHALGRLHAPGCISSGDPNYPQYADYPPASIGECGIDSRILEVFDPRKTFDYMSYCSPVWTSPYGYMQILSALQSGSFSSEGTGTSLRPNEPSPKQGSYHYLSFQVHRGGSTYDQDIVKIISAFQIIRSSPRSVSNQSDIIIELYDEKDTLLYSARCESDEHKDDNIPFENYRVWFPEFTEIHHIKLVREEHVLKEYTRAEQAPEVLAFTMTQAGDLIRLEWKARSDQDQIEYGLRFSRDGKRWRSIVAASHENQAVVNSTLLPGGNDCRFQLVVSAGFRTALQETNCFSLPVKPREAYIALPKAKAEYEVGEPITFSGTGFSPDFGNSKPDEIFWSSLLSGVIGVGHSVTTAELPVGYHWVTLQVPDGMGKLASQTIAVRVVPKKPVPCGDNSWREIPKERLKRL